VLEAPGEIAQELFGFVCILHFPGLAPRRVIASLSMRLHHLLGDLESYTLKSGTQRVIGYLLSLSEIAGGSTTQIELPVRKNIIASRLNLTHEHFSRTLHGLAAAGLISVDGQKIGIASIEKLRAYNG